MREAPEIAPEIRGLLEELVADPRSSIRLVPRRALRSWFDSDETIRPREVSGTKLERHLMEAHREELAQLLFEASRIAYWKAPVLTVRPVGVDGRPFDPAVAEESWRPRAQMEGASCRPGSEVGLLRDCLESIPPQLGLSLSLAALALAPSDKTRLALIECIPWSRPRTAIGLLDRLAARARPTPLGLEVLRVLAGRLCSVGRLRDARAIYHESIASDPGAQVDWLCSLNLSCFLQEKSAAIADAAELDRLSRKKDPRLLEARDLLRGWVKSRTKTEVASASVLVLEVASMGYESAALLREAFEA